VRAALDQTHIRQLHATTQRGARGYSVHAQLVAEVIGEDDLLHIVHTTLGPQGPQALVLRALSFSFRCLGHPAASDGAAPAGTALAQVSLLQGLAGNGLRALEARSAEVASGEDAEFVHEIDQDRGAEAGQAHGGHRVGFDPALGLVEHESQSLCVGHVDLPLPPHHQRLEVLGAHDRPYAAAPAGAGSVVHHRGVEEAHPEPPAAQPFA